MTTPRTIELADQIKAVGTVDLLPIERDLLMRVRDKATPAVKYIAIYLLADKDVNEENGSDDISVLYTHAKKAVCFTPTGWTKAAEIAFLKAVVAELEDMQAESKRVALATPSDLFNVCNMIIQADNTNRSHTQRAVYATLLINQKLLSLNEISLSAFGCAGQNRVVMRHLEGLKCAGLVKIEHHAVDGEIKTFARAVPVATVYDLLDQLDPYKTNSTLSLYVLKLVLLAHVPLVKITKFDIDSELDGLADQRLERLEFNMLLEEIRFSADKHKAELIGYYEQLKKLGYL